LSKSHFVVKSSTNNTRLLTDVSVPGHSHPGLSAE
jgi:hypothetical protein